MGAIQNASFSLSLGGKRQMMNRVIGEYIGTTGGPLLIIFGAMHGNEPAGVKAIDLALKMLEVEPIKNPDFKYYGTMLGLIGNLSAYKNGERFINKDLNRCWLKDDIHKMGTEKTLSAEEEEMNEVLSIVKKSIAKHVPSKVIFLDLHTTSSDGGIFSIVGDGQASLNIAKQIHAPVILGMLEGLRGTTLHYFTEENINYKTAALTFESGQHEDPLSVNRAIAAIITCMRTIESVKPTDVENQHDSILKRYSENLPEVARLLYNHRIVQGDEFKMKEGYQNFQKVSLGETLAIDSQGEIKAKNDGMILMPLYQKKGEDGFFIIKEVVHEN